MEKEDLIFHMEIIMKAILKKDIRVVMVKSYLKVEQNLVDFGKMIEPVDKDKCYMQMVINLQANIKIPKKMAMEIMVLNQVLFLKVILKMINFKEMVI